MSNHFLNQLKTSTLIFVLILSFSSQIQSQTRNGWRSLFDKFGRLSQMQYFDNGTQIKDSSIYLQYNDIGGLKGKIRGEITPQYNCESGTLYRFNDQGGISTINHKREGQVVYNITCDAAENCTASWVDLFNKDLGYWESTDTLEFENSEMILTNHHELATAIYKPAVPINLYNDYTFVVRIPSKGNSIKQGIIIGWKDKNNFLLYEISFSQYFSIIQYIDGEPHPITDSKKNIDKVNSEFNELAIKSKNGKLLFELNGKIEMIIPAPEYAGNQIGFMTRVKGKTRFSDMLLSYPLKKSEQFFTDEWVGLGSGLFITSEGKILTTYDVVKNAKSLRVHAYKGGVETILTAKVTRTDEDRNLAILEIENNSYIPFETIPFGYLNRKPVSESKVFALGYANAISGIFNPATQIEGTVLSSGATRNWSIMLEMPFRQGMLGSPVFDANANLIGIVDSRGEEVNYTEIIDFIDNSIWIKTQMGKIDRSRESPFRDLPYEDKVNRLSETVVLIESSIFNIDVKGN